jgi:excisionase family DNA binding protein
MPSDRLDAALRELADALRAEIAAEAVAAASAPEPLYDLASVSALTSLGRTFLYGEIQAGRLKSVKCGRRRLIPASAIADYTARRS